MAELSDGAPLFPGDSDMDQLYITQRMLGEWLMLHHACAAALLLLHGPGCGKRRSVLPRHEIASGCSQLGVRSGHRKLMTLPLWCAPPRSVAGGAPLTPDAPLSPCLPSVRAGPLCRKHDILFLSNPRFAGIKFPDLGPAETLDRRYRSIMAPEALAFLR